MTLLIVALGTLLGGGLLALATSHSARLASASGAIGALFGCALGEAYALRALLVGGGGALALRWQVPYGWMRIGTDPLSAFFLVPIFGLGALLAPYGALYLYPRRQHKTLGPPWLAFNALVASMALVVVARQAVLFLVAWEAMSLSAFVCVTFEQEDAEVARGGWAYLIASHLGTAALLSLFLLFNRHAKGFDFEAFSGAAMTPSLSSLLAALALFGFGVKAGFVPLHVWLPEAHAAAPSHVSALMSGVLIDMGLYGLLRTVLLLQSPPTWLGPLLMGIGLMGAVIGITLASYQRDMKRVLAYSSIENIGLIALAVGTGFWGSTTGRPQVAALGIAAALLHIWNHTSMKGLLFLTAGSVLHGTGTKDLERLGGALKRMPWTGALMIFGSLAIAGLPPLNGFVSEWLLYLGLAYGGLSSSGPIAVFLMIVVGTVSLVGALAGVAFVRLVATSLLGQPRDEAAARAHESPALMVLPMMALAAICVAMGLHPQPFLGALSPVADELLGQRAALAAMGAPIDTLTRVAGAAGGLAVLGVAAATLVLRTGRAASDTTWGCGYAQPTARMQYTARAFSEMLADRLVPKLLRVRVSIAQPRDLFPGRAMLASDCRDPVTRGIYEPFLERWADRFARLRWLQQGMLHVYLVYILVSLLVGLAWSSFSSWSDG